MDFFCNRETGSAIYYIYINRFFFHKTIQIAKDARVDKFMRRQKNQHTMASYLLNYSSNLFFSLTAPSHHPPSHPLHMRSSTPPTTLAQPLPPQPCHCRRALYTTFYPRPIPSSVTLSPSLHCVHHAVVRFIRHSIKIYDFSL